jgi:hypothetical protein
MVPLPLEILSEILKNLTLHECNRAALNNCSLVCSTWHTIVRPWICASITLYFEGPPYSRLMQTQEVFSASPCMPAYVRTLYIQGSDRHMYIPEGIVVLLRAMDELGIITALSGHVRCLVLDFEYYADESKDLYSDYLAKFSTVLHLHLSRTTVPSYALLKSTFPIVDQLYLDVVDFEEPFHLGDETIKRLYISTAVNYPITHSLPSDQEHGVSPWIHVELKWWSQNSEDVRIEGHASWKVIDAIPTTLKSLTLRGENFAGGFHREQVLREYLCIHSPACDCDGLIYWCRLLD